MNETLLLFHAPSRPELLKIQRALLPLHIRLRCISFPYKAILTPTNCEWNALTCFNEVKKEHEQMHK